MDIEEQLLVAQAEMIGSLTAWATGLPFVPDPTIEPRMVTEAALMLCKAVLGGKADRGVGLLRDLGEMVAGQLFELRERQRPAGGQA